MFCRFLENVCSPDLWLALLTLCRRCNGSGRWSSASHRRNSTALVGFVVYKVALAHIYLQELHFSAVSIIPLLLHTHSFIYHTRCITFLSQYFSFPLSVSFHHCSFIHLPHTLYNVFLPVLQISPVSIIPPLRFVRVVSHCCRLPRCMSRRMCREPVQCH